MTAREVVSALGPLGYRLEVCDPNPLCLARLSRFVRGFHRCPALGADPLGYLDFVARRLAARHYDVLLPVHEQAFVLASHPHRVMRHAGLAVSSFDAFLKTQSKIAFAGLLTELDLPQPDWRVVTSVRELLESGAVPCYVKAPYGTASRGVWRVDSQSHLASVAATVERDGLLEGGWGMLVQAAVAGRQCQVQSVFQWGRLVAIHCTAQTEMGMNGGPATRVGVDHPAVREHVAALGRHLDWHGGLTLDYLEDARGQPWYIEANPRLVEPMNAALSGVNLADILVRVSLGEHIGGALPLRGRPGVISHSAISVLLGTASRTGSRPEVLRALMSLARPERGAEQATPASDPPSLLALGFVAGRLLLDPRSAAAIAGTAVADYCLTRDAVRCIVAHNIGRIAGG